MVTFTGSSTNTTNYSPSTGVYVFQYGIVQPNIDLLNIFEAADMIIIYVAICVRQKLRVCTARLAITPVINGSVQLKEKMGSWLQEILHQALTIIDTIATMAIGT